MSNVIDQRVAELRFDNAHFEKNVATSMSTLDKLKQKLNLTGASKGLENLGTAAKGIKLAPLASSIETVGVKFNAAYTIADQFFRNITNRAISSGEQLVKSLSVDQVMAGWNKYDQKTSSVQTIMNATGKSIDEVNAYLEKLMWFSDETSYSFTDMASGLATMVSSGGDIDKLIPLITGVANATAFAGKGAAEFSRVLQYGVNQAYSLGYMQVQDWKTIEGATVNSRQLMQSLIDAAEAMGKIEKGAVTVQNFRSSLKDQWLDTEVMEEGFGRFSEFSEAVNRFVNGDLEGFSDEIKALYDPDKIETAADAMDVLGEYYDELGVKAFRSAQEAKTFTEAIDATKDAVSSGWMKTFEIIFGTYEEAKKVWTDVANWLWDIFASGSERRNELLSEVMNYSPMGKFAEKLKEISKVATKVTDAVDKVTKTVEDYNEVVKQVIRLEWGYGTDRWQRLTEAGYDWATVQNMVNEELDCSVRHATNFKFSQEEIRKETVKLTDAKLEELGLTKEEIELYRELERQSEKTGKSIEELIAEMGQMDGRTLLIESFRNIGNAITGILTAIKEAWGEIFGSASAVQIYNVLKKFYDMTSALRLINTETGELNENGEKIKDTFKGIFAIIDLVATTVSTVITVSIDALSKALGLFNIDVLGATASVGDMLVKFRDWVKENDYIYKGVSAIVNAISTCIKFVVNLIKSFVELPVIQGVIDGIANGFTKLKDAITNFDFGNIGSGLKDTASKFTEVGGHAVSGLLGGLQNGAAKVWQYVSEIGRKMIDTICSVLGINSPSLEFQTIGIHVISGLVSGLKSGKVSLKAIIIELGGLLIRTLCDFLGIASPAKAFINIGKWCIEGLLKGFKITSSGGIVAAMKNVGKAILTAIKKVLGINSPAKSFIEIAKDCVEGLGVGFKEGLSRIKEFAKEFADGFAKFWGEIEWGKVMAVGLSVGALVAIKKLADAMVTFTKPLADVAGGMGSMLKSIGDGLEAKFKAQALDKKSTSILKIAIAIGILVAAVVVLTKIPVGTLWSSIGALAALAGIIVALSVACEKLNKGDTKFGLQSASLLAIAASIALLVVALKKLSEIDVEAIPRTFYMLAGIVIALGFFVASIMVLSNEKTYAEVGRIGGLLIKLSVALLMMVGVIKIASLLDESTVKRGMGTIALVGLFFAAIIAVTRIVGPTDAKKVGQMLTRISFALLIMVAVIKLASKLERGEVIRGLGVIYAVGGLFAALIAVSRFAGENASKAGGMLLKISTALLIMVAVVKIAAGLSMTEILKGVAVIAAFGGIISGLVAISHFAGEQADKAGKMLMEAAVAMLILSVVLIILKELDSEGMVKALGIMTVLGGIIAGLIAVTSLIKNPDKIQGILTVLTISIAVLAGTLITLSFLNPKKVATAGAALTLVLGVFALLIKSINGLKMDKRTWLRKLAAIGVLTLVVAAIGGVIYMLSKTKKPQHVLSIAEGISILLATMAVSLRILSDSKSFNANKLINILAVMAILSTVVYVLAKVLESMQNVDGTHAIGNATAISILIGTLSLLTAALTKMDGRKTGKLPKIIANIALLSGVCIILAVVIGLMKDVPADRGIANATALSELISVLAGVTILLSRFSKSSSNLYGSVGAIAILSAVMAELAGTLIEMDKVDAQKSIPNARALSELMVVLSGVIIPISRFTKVSGKLFGAVGAMAVLGTVLYELAGALIIMKDIDADNGIKNATALTIMMVALGGLPVAFSYLCKNPVGMFAGAAVMAILAIAVAELAVILALMDKIDGKNAIANAAALSLLLTFMTPVAATMALLGAFAVPMLAGIGAMAVLGLVVGMLAEVLIEAKELDPVQSIGVAVALGVLMGTMTIVIGALLAIGSVIVATGVFGVAAIAAGFAVMVAVIAGIVGVIAAAGYLTDRWENLETFVDKGLGLFKKLAEGIGEIVGLLLGGILTGVQSSLPNFGTALSEFMTNVQGFIDGARALGDDESFKSGVKTLTGAILLLLAAEFINNVINAMSLGVFGSLTSLGLELSAFWIAAKVFIDGAKQLDPKLMEGVKTLSEAILILTAAQFLDGIMRWTTGGINFQLFADGMATLGTGIKKFVSNAGKLDDNAVDVAGKAADIISTLATAASNIPNAGGWLGKIFGENDLKTWTLGFGTIADGVTTFCNKLVENNISEDSVKIAQKAAKIITELATAASNIPNSGGWLGAILGNNDMSTWAEGLGTVGDGVAKFCNHFKDAPLTDDHVKLAENAGKIITSLATASAAIPNAGGWLANLIGENDLTTWADQMPNLASGVTGFINNLGDFDDTQIEKANSAAKLISAIANMCKQNAGLSFVEITERFAGFKTAMNSIGDGVKAFVDKMSGVTADGINNAAANLKATIDAYASVADTDLSALSSFGESLGKFAKEGIDTLVNAFKSEEAKTEINTAGGALMDSFVKGVEAKENAPKKAVKSAVKKAYKAAGSEDMKLNFYDAGIDCIKGFANGLKDSETLKKVTAAGTSLGKKALEAAKKALDENSPSKEMYKVGEFAGLGFTNALFDHESTAYDSGYAMAEYAKNGLSKAISKINDLFGGEIDTQPTIRPVLDLSDVTAGAGVLNGMFDTTANVGVSSNIRSISSMMNNRQNGNNNEVISAIKDLGASLGNNTGDSYYINGVSYDGENGVAEAIKTIARAALVERRI